MNLFVLDPKTKATRQLTHFDDFDIKFPSLGDKAIVFENGGFIYRFDLATQQAVKVPVYLHEDLATGRDGWKNVGNEVTTYDISPDGHRAVFGARGNVFTVPAKYGNTRNLTQTSGVHERNAVWSPDGKSIAYISDATGEEEIYVVPQDGSGPARQLTSGGDTYKYDLLWSPDSKRIALVRQEAAAAVRGRAIEGRDAGGPIDGLGDQRLPMVARQPVDGLRQAGRPADAEDLPVLGRRQKSWPVTDEWFVSSEPVFSADGKYLFFVSNRNYHPGGHHQTEDEDDFPFGMARIYFVTLAKDTKSLVAPKSDEVEPEPSAEKKTEAAEKGKRGKAKAEAAKKVVVKVDLDGLADRVDALPLPPASYGHLTCVDGRLYYCRHGHADGKPRLMVYDFEKRKETELRQPDRLPDRRRRHEDSRPLGRLVRDYRAAGRQGEAKDGRKRANWT